MFLFVCCLESARVGGSRCRSVLALVDLATTLCFMSDFDCFLSAEDTYTKDVPVNGREIKVHVLDTAGNDGVC